METAPIYSVTEKLPTNERDLDNEYYCYLEIIKNDPSYNYWTPLLFKNDPKPYFYTVDNINYRFNVYIIQHDISELDLIEYKSSYRIIKQNKVLKWIDISNVKP